MDEKKHTEAVSGKRLLPGSGPAISTPLLIAGIVAAVLVVLYASLCAYVAFGGRILPHVYLARTPVGGMTISAAQQAIEADTNAYLEQISLPLSYGKNGETTIGGTFAAVDPDCGAAAHAVGRQGHPITYGANFLTALFRNSSAELRLVPNPDAPQGDALLDRTFKGHETPVTQSAYTVTEETIEMTKGTPGYQYDRTAAAQALADALCQWVITGVHTSVHLDPIQVEPTAIDWSALARKLAVEPADAALNPETMEIEPSVTGVSLDTVQAAALYDSAAPGSVVSIPLTLTPPSMTTEQLEATLFRDLLGEATSKVSGVANRKQNVKLAAELVHGTMLLPEGIFAYNECTGPRTAANGFRPAPSYVNGLTVDEVGGGICQVSSTTYYAALHANLKIVERKNHSYAVGYVPDGMDATVFFGSLDFRFQNDTPSPIKIVTETYDKNGARWLTVKIYGTKSDDTYVKMESKRISTTAYETIYKADAAIPAGTTKVSVTPYTGRKVESYRCIYAADGTLISRTLESVSNYKKRDKVILYNPADAHLYDPNAPQPSPTATPAVNPDVTPLPSQSPAPTELPATAVPTVTATPEPVSPEFSAPPAVSEPTATPTVTPEPTAIDTLPNRPQPQQ